MIIYKNQNEIYQQIIFEPEFVVFVNDTKGSTKIKRQKNDTYFIKQIRIRQGSKILFMQNSRISFKLILILNNQRFYITCSVDEYEELVENLRLIGAAPQEMNHQFTMKMQNIREIIVKRYQTSDMTADEIGLKMIKDNGEFLDIMYGDFPRFDAELSMFFEMDNHNISIKNQLIDMKYVIVFWQVVVPIVLFSIFLIQDASLHEQKLLYLIMLTVLNICVFSLAFACNVAHVLEQKRLEFLIPRKSNYKTIFWRNIFLMLMIWIAVSLFWLGIYDAF